MWRIIPFGLYGHLIGLLSIIPIPKFARERLWGFLCRKIGIDASLARLPLNKYSTFQGLFTRQLCAQSRPIAAADWISPVDGEITTCGQIRTGILIQAKSLDYTLNDFVGAPDLATRLEGGHFLTLYLSPKDYHRVHVPAAGKLLRAYRIKGRAYPVRPSYVRKVPRLFCLNDRVVFEFLSYDGVPYSVVCVGAAAVRSISSPYLKLAKMPVSMSQGDHLATFNLGSTVIVLIGKQADIRCEMLVPALIKMGGPLLVKRRTAAMHRVPTGRYRLGPIDK